MATLERAIAIAAEAHAGQTDKARQPYILHPLRVMFAAPTWAREVAVLHDVLEDCPNWSMARLVAEGFGPEAITALDAVTRRDGEAYEAYVSRCAANRIGRAVKIADLQDNLDPVRRAILPPGTVNVDRYENALRTLVGY